MEDCKQKRKKDGGILRRTWERCKSFSHIGQTQTVLNKPSSDPHASLPPTQLIFKSKSWSSIFPPTTPPSPWANKWTGFKKARASFSTPKGCLSVYVGPERQKFVIKIEYTSHPSFKMLLEEAEHEYGFHNDGPIVLPCDVQMFTKVLFDIDTDHDEHVISSMGCSPRTRSSYHLLSPSTKMVSFDQLV